MVKKLDTVHPKTLLDERAKCRDSIQKLMRIIIAQGTTISTQLAGLKEKEEAIDNFEERMHNLRMRESGRDYLLHTYLDQLPEAQSKDPLCVTPPDQQAGLRCDEGGPGPGQPQLSPLRRSEARGAGPVDRGAGQAGQDQRGPDNTGGRDTQAQSKDTKFKRKTKK